jgi:Zn-dependent alcohol dehydrogenase
VPTDARVVVVPAGSGPLRIDEVQLPDPGPHQVVVQQFASGICHSQLHQMHGARPMPAILGHESTGVVLAAGSEVTHVGEGDKVMVTWVPRRPGSTRPTEIATLALPDGTTAVSQNVFTWADRTITDEQFVVAMPDDVPTDVTSIIGCAVMTGAGAVVHTAGVQRGQSVAVIGVGGVGLSAIVAAKVIGADPIIAVDLDDEKLEVARRFGATETVNASSTDAVAGIRALTTTSDPTERGFLGQPIAGADFVFDCIGLKVTMDQIVPAARDGVFGTKPGGTGVLVGVPRGNAELNSIDVLLNEKRFIGSIGGSCHPERDFPMFLDWSRDGRLDLDALVTARYALDDINQATTDLEEGRIFGRAILVFD